MQRRLLVLILLLPGCQFTCDEAEPNNDRWNFRADGRGYVKCTCEDPNPPVKAKDLPGIEPELDKTRTYPHMTELPP